MAASFDMRFQRLSQSILLPRAMAVAGQAMTIRCPLLVLEAEETLEVELVVALEVARIKAEVRAVEMIKKGGYLRTVMVLLEAETTSKEAAKR
jgi:hypothetical protein